MAHAYTPGLRVTKAAIIRKERRLPLPGQVLAEKGDRVRAEDVVARTELPGNVQPINVAGLLSVPPEDVPQLMLKKEGESVRKGEPIAQSKGFFGLLLEGLSRGEAVYGFIDQFTTPTWVGDLVKGIMEAVGKRGIFHISGGKFLSRFDFAQKVAQVFGYDPHLVKPEESASVRFVANRPPKGGLRVDKARRVLGYTPHSITEALETIKKERDEG